MGVFLFNQKKKRGKKGLSCVFSQRTYASKYFKSSRASSVLFPCIWLPCEVDAFRACWKCCFLQLPLSLVFVGVFCGGFFFFAAQVLSVQPVSLLGVNIVVVWK